MTERDAQQLERIIPEMTDAERRALRDRLDRSLDGGPGTSCATDQMTPDEKQEVLDVLEEVTRLPAEHDPYAHLGYSDRTHDKILYDLQEK